MGGGGLGGNYSVKVINSRFQGNDGGHEGGGLNIDIDTEDFNEAHNRIVELQRELEK